ncbi:MAG: sugar phosphate isomerase/epimerase [Hespellia sp.]|nr:sugar phosphate isomerase/epimerase [Hespellia sp.]
MKIGFISSILNQYSFEEVIDLAAELGYSCVEMACWPNCAAERRYAGVCHIDVNTLTDEKALYIKDYCAARRVEISALAFYSNTMDSDKKKREENISHLKKVIDGAVKLDVGIVTTFVGREQEKSIEENMKEFQNVWPDIISYAEKSQVKIAVENCPMLFGREQWPGGQNLAVSPQIWKEMFELIPSKFFGINYDPSHFVWQMMDYIQPIYDYKEKIFHVHFKDIKLYKNRLNQVGIMAYPLEYMQPKLPGLGDVEWSAYVSAMTDIGYKGYACIEIEDRSFEGSAEDIKKSLILSKRYIEQFLI